MISLDLKTDDHPDYIRSLEALLAGALSTLRAETVTVVRVDNWFDRKWLGFSGKGAVRCDMSRFDLGLDEFRNDALSPPPFTPNRIDGQLTYRWCGYNERFLTAPRAVHLHRRGRSAGNLQLRLEDMTDDHLLVWYSGRTKPNGRGCVLMVLVKDGETAASYVSMNEDKDWQPHAAQGAPLETIREYATRGAVLVEERARRVPCEEEVLTARLCAAIKGARLADVADAVLSDVELERHGPDGNTPLLVALEEQQLEAARYLIKAGANPFQQDVFGYGALHYCADRLSDSDDWLTMTSALAALGVDLEARTVRGETPLHIAAGLGDGRMVALLVDLGADVRAVCGRRWTPLHEAAAGGHVGVVRLLLDRGARVGARNKARVTPMMEAARCGHAECVEVLHGAGSSLETEARGGHTALSIALQKGHDEVVKLIRGWTDAAGS